VCYIGFVAYKGFVGYIGFNVGYVGFIVGHVGFNVGYVGFIVGYVGFNVGYVGFNVGYVGLYVSQRAANNQNVMFRWFLTNFRGKITRCFDRPRWVTNPDEVEWESGWRPA
jgi:hypothetical protein